MDSNDGFLSALDEAFDDGAQTSATDSSLSVVDEALPPVDNNKPNDPFHTLQKGLNMQVGAIKQNYYNAGIMARVDLSDEDEIKLIQNSTRQNYGDLTDEEIKAAPWYVQAGIDAGGIGLSLGNAFAAGGATGLATAKASTPLAAVSTRLPFIGPVLAGAIEGMSFTSGFTTGSLSAIGTQAAGEMYGDLRLKGVSRNNARAISSAYGVFNAALNSIELGTVQKLGGLTFNAVSKRLPATMSKSLFNTKNAAARQVQSTLRTRLAAAFVQNTAVETGVSEMEILSSHGAKAMAGFLEKQDFSTYTSWDEAGTEMKDSFLNLLVASAFVSSGVTALSAGAGSLMNKDGTGLNEQKVKMLEEKFKNVTPQDVMKKVSEALDDQPYPFEKGQGDNVAITEDGKVLRTTNEAGETILQGGVEVNEQVPNQTELDATKGPTDEVIAQAENALDETPLGQTIKKNLQEDPEFQAALDDIMSPKDDNFAAADTKGQAIDAVEDVDTPLSLEETRARINQVAADTRILKKEQKKLESQFNRKEKQGHSTDATLKKLDTVMNTIEELQLERDLLEEGMLSREEVAGSRGQQRMTALARIMDKIQKANERNAQQRERFEAQIIDSRQTGRNVERRHIQSLQKQLRQYINGATKDRNIRTQLARLVNSVTSDAQFKAAGEKIRDQLIKLEQQKQDGLVKSEKQKLIDDIDKIVKQGSKVKMQSGKPVSNLDADTINNMQLFKGYLQDQTLPKKKQQKLAEKAITEFHEKTDADTDTTYGELLASGQAHAIPAAEYQKYMLAVMANDIKNQSLLELNVTKGNLAQMLEDSKNYVAEKQAVLKEKRTAENEVAEASIGADTHVRIEGNPTPGKKIKQDRESAGAGILSWPSLMEFISPKDKGHAIRDLMDTTKAKGDYLANKEIHKAGLKQLLQQKLIDIGSDADLMRYMTDASNAEFEFRYPRSDGTTGTARYTRAQLVRILNWMKDEDLHPTMRDHEKGNGWTLEGDTKNEPSFQELIYTVLTPEDIAVADGMIEFFDTYGRNRVNPYYRDKYGADLPIKKNYSPVSREVHKIEVGKKRQQMFSSLLPGAAKTRVNSLKRLVPDNAFDAMDSHIDDWEHFIAFDEIFGTMQNVFKRNTKIRNTIRDNHGKGTLQVIDNYMDRFVDDTPFQNDNAFNSALRGSLAKAVLPWRAPVQILQQLSAGTSMWKEHSLPEVAAGMVEMVKHPKKTREAFLKSPILKHRYEGGASFDLYTAINQAGLAELAASKITGIDNVLDVEQQHALIRLGFEGIRRGDAATVQMFGGPVYWAEIARGKSPEQAIRTVERMAESTQQGDSVDQIPYFYASNPTMYTLFGQFKMQPLQLFSHVSNAFRDLGSNPTSPKAWAQIGKQLAIMSVIPGLVFGAVQNAPSYFMPPNEDEETRNIALTNIGVEATVGTMFSLPIAGDILEAAVFRALQPLIGVDVKYRTDINNNPVAERFEAIFKMKDAWDKVLEPEDTTKLPSLKDLSKDPAEDTFKAIFKTTRALGPLTGIPTQFVNAPTGAVNALRHDDWIGAMFAIGGWSPGSIQTRYNVEDSIALPSFKAEPQSAVDWIKEGIIELTEEDEEQTPQADDAILNGILYDTVESDF